MSEVLTTYKGTDKDMKCHGGFQYELGKTYTDDGAIRCGNKGFHSCEAPLDVFAYFAPSNGNRFFVAEADGEISKGTDDSKIASSKLTLKTEIGIPGLIKAQIEYVRSRCTNEHNAEAGKPATAGDSGAATAGFRGAATAGSYGAATSRGSVSVGENGVGTVRGNNVKIRGGMGAFLSIAVENDCNYGIAYHKTFIVDGETIKPNTWYTLKNGEIVECKEENE